MRPDMHLSVLLTLLLFQGLLMIFFKTYTVSAERGVLCYCILCGHHASSCSLTVVLDQD